MANDKSEVLSSFSYEIERDQHDSYTGVLPTARASNKISNPTSPPNKFAPSFDVPNKFNPDNTSSCSYREELDQQRVEMMYNTYREQASEPFCTSLISLFHFADPVDYFLMFVGTVSAICMGLLQPGMTYVFGKMFDNFFLPPDEFQDEVVKQVKVLLVFAGIALVSGYFQVVCWTATADRQVRRLRQQYVAALLHQDVAWFDLRRSGELVGMIVEQTLIVQDGIGRKWADGVQYGAMFVGGYTLGFMKSWRLTVVLIAVLPLIGGTAWHMINSVSRSSKEAQEAYGKAGAIATEVLSSIRTVLAFNAEKREYQRYSANLSDAEHVGVKKSLHIGVATGLFYLITFSSYAIGLWYGGTLVARDIENGCDPVASTCITGGTIVAVFFGVILGSVALGQATPSFTAAAAARAAMSKLFQVIKNRPKISSESAKDIALDEVRGLIEFRNIHFFYPSRPETKIANGYNLTIYPGERVAFCGPSGSGKSTAVGLIERFYDPIGGEIFLDGVNIRNLNVKWLRRQIGLVSQEPILFTGSIADNIGFGREGASFDDIVAAARLANAHDFISAFPNRYETEVGERGIQLSGGQKQRIAIARAIIRKPSILILDEATSALDFESERIVQDSLDSLMRVSRQTTIIIAHRLSTIRHASRIAVFESGNLVEIGTHEELLSTGQGLYRRLVENQIGRDNDGSSEAKETAHLSEFKDTEGNNAGGSSVIGLESSPHTASFTENGASVTTSIVPFSRLWSIGKAYKKHLGVGFLGAVGNGLVFPLWGLLIAQMIASFFSGEGLESAQKAAKVRHDSNFFAVMFAVLAVESFLANVVQFYGFGAFGERLTRKFRELSFDAILHHEVDWFDKKENNSGALCSRLSEDSSLIQAQTGENMARHVANILALIISLLISFFFSWEMSLIMLACFPFLAFSGVIEYARLLHNTGEVKYSSIEIVAQAVQNIRTVAAFGLENAILERYISSLDRQRSMSSRQSSMLGLGFGTSQMFVFGVFGFVFWYGSTLLGLPDDSPRHISFKALLVSVLVIVLSAFGFGNAAQGMTDVSKAKAAVRSIFALLDGATPEMEIASAQPNLKGAITFDKVSFKYPSRPDLVVCSEYTLNIKHGDITALVGKSGCGKSTIVSLLERFYEPTSGTIFLDGQSLSDISRKWLRANIGLVGQEPVLFSGTIAENIAYGKPGASSKEIMEAAQMANAHGFIESLPEKYQTQVGEKGIQLSGGQKQRIAIARAILKNPTILILDEATSALDTESEAIVQSALDNLLLQKKRTTIVIAHRLSTIRTADKIICIENGKIVEEGTHEELIARGGEYASLVQHGHP